MGEGESKTWEKVFEQLTLSQMPPEGEKQPDDAGEGARDPVD